MELRLNPTLGYGDRYKLIVAAIDLCLRVLSKVSTDIRELPDAVKVKVSVQSSL